MIEKESKITFKELSTPLKTAIVFSYFVMVLYGIIFLTGFITALIE